MIYNISEAQARAILGDLRNTPTYDNCRSLFPLYHRIGEVFPDLKAEYSYLDWAKFKESEK